MLGDVGLIRSPISVIGTVLTTISAVLFLVVFLADLFGLPVRYRFRIGVSSLSQGFRYLSGVPV